jgi:hypothetical protein
MVKNKILLRRYIFAIDRMYPTIIKANSASLHTQNE